MNSRSCVVVLSGGQDSTTCLALALKSYSTVYTIGFQYGQRHEVELQCRSRILRSIEFVVGTRSLGPDLLVDMKSFGAIASCSLTELGVPIAFDERTKLPNTFVPGRNLVFLTYAAALAWKAGARDIITGVGEADYSGYPDCREMTLRALEKALNLGMQADFRLVAPLMHRTKKQTWELAEETGGRTLVDFIRTETHTCYEGDHTHLHDWGYGCGRCPACRLRQKGWEEYAASRGL